MSIKKLIPLALIMIVLLGCQAGLSAQEQAATMVAQTAVAAPPLVPSLRLPAFRLSNMASWRWRIWEGGNSWVRCQKDMARLKPEEQSTTSHLLPGLIHLERLIIMPS